MILIVGDSNLRNVVEENKLEIQGKLNEEVTFEQAGTNDSIKAILDANKHSCSTIVIGTLLNEIGKLAKAVKTRDEVINNVTKEQAEIIARDAERNQDTTSWRGT